MTSGGCSLPFEKRALSAPSDPNSLVQVCLIRVGAELCRKVDLQEQG